MRVVMAALLLAVAACSACVAAAAVVGHRTEDGVEKSSSRACDAAPNRLRDSVARERLQAFAAFAGGKGPACRGPETQYGQAGNFSLIVFQQCWAAGFCNAEHTSRCAAPTDWMRTHLIVHGVWPTFDAIRDGHVGPQCCDTPFGPHLPAAAIASQRAELERNWPGMGVHVRPRARQTPNPAPAPALQSGGPRGLWEHEWAKHGTCSGKSQTHYFGTSLALQRAMPMPATLQQAIGKTIEYDALLRAYTPPDPDPHADVDVDAAGDGDDASAGNGDGSDRGDGDDGGDAQQWVGFECHLPPRPHGIAQRHNRADARGSGVQELVHVTTCWSRDEQKRVRCPEWILHVQQSERCTPGPVHVPVFADPPPTRTPAPDPGPGDSN